MTRVLILCVVLFGGATTASANIITINAADYPLGTDLSTMLEGVSMSRLVNRPNADGINGRTVFDPVASSVLLSEVNLVGQSFGGSFRNFEDFEVCQRMGSSGAGCGYNVMQLEFSTPTNFVQLLSASFSDPAGIAAFDIFGNRIAMGVGSTERLTNTPEQYLLNTLVVAREQNDIARVVFGGFSTASRPTEITYNRVPEPSTLLIMSMGVLAAARWRKRK